MTTTSGQSAWGFKHARVLSKYLALDMPGFWVYHGFKYARVTQGYEYA